MCCLVSYLSYQDVNEIARPNKVGSLNLLLIVCLLMASPVFSGPRLVDATGVEVQIHKPANRVVALAPHIVESVFAVGGGEHLIGVVSHSDFPAQAQSIEQVGTYKKINFERIIALAPDLVIAFGSGNGYEMINRLRQLGLRVYVEEPRTLEDVATSLRHIGLLMGRQPEGEKQARLFLERLANIKSKYADRKPISVFYQVWNQPLFTVNDQHIISDVIRLCGGRNIFAEAKPLVPKVGIEAIIHQDPEVIFASGMGEERPDWLDDWSRWPTLAAVKNQRLYYVPPDIIQRHTPRILDGAQRVCEQLDEARKL